MRAWCFPPLLWPKSLVRLTSLESSISVSGNGIFYEKPEPFVLFALGYGGSGVTSSASCSYRVADLVFFAVFGVQAFTGLLIVYFGRLSADVENFYISSEFKVRLFFPQA